VSVSVVRTGAGRLRRRRFLAAGALVPAAALLLSACGKSGVAATIDGRTITVEQLHSAVASLKAADRQAFSSITDAQVLQVYLYAPYAEHAASVAGKGISDDEVRQAIAAAAAQNNDKTSRPDRLNGDALAVLRGNLALSQLDDTVKNDIFQQLQKAHVEISPRYGTYDAKNGTISAPSPNWLQPTASPSASPSATG
jgi:hypothetical protein